MVNASLNWASLVGLLLLLVALPASVAAGFQIAFLLGRRRDASARVMVAAIWHFFVLLLRLVALPVVGSILFFQGWRLDPILQFGVFLLVGAYLGELIAGLVVEFSSWKKRG